MAQYRAVSEYRDMSELTGSSLSPAQRAVFQGMKRGLVARPMAYLKGAAGRGMSTVLRALASEHGAKVLSAPDFAPAIAKGHPLAYEDQVMALIAQQIVPGGCLVVDDLHLVLSPAQHHFAPRYGLVQLPLLALCQQAELANCKLILGAACCIPPVVEQRGFGFSIPRFRASDYEFLLHRWAPRVAGNLDIERIFRFAPKLDAHRLHSVAEWWRHHTGHTTDEFIEVLRSQRLGSNVDLGEVQDVSLGDLVGVDDAVETLLRTIVLPHEDEALAKELGLRAKRGVLLYGPPGSGKTTVGRALAHRLRGKFFLIDGTFIAGTDDFYNKVRSIFEAAKENSPSVIFVDDADAIFENRSERGLYRYLLTMIDGLESESNAQVTVMLTAMNLGDLPEALVRSGRVELWLEMRLPDPAARRILLDRECAAFPEQLRGAITQPVVDATDGLTGADLKACAADAKSLYAAARKAGQPAKDLASYLLEAASMIRVYREKHQQALTQAKMRQAKEAMMPGLGMFMRRPPLEEE
jgi:transitional endoplasmic reticulum ATPase